MANDRRFDPRLPIVGRGVQTRAGAEDIGSPLRGLGCSKIALGEAASARSTAAGSSSGGGASCANAQDVRAVYADGTTVVTVADALGRGESPRVFTRAANCRCSLLSNGTRNGTRASRRVGELSRFNQPSVAVLPQPTLIRIAAGSYYSHYWSAPARTVRLRARRAAAAWLRDWSSCTPSAWRRWYSPSNAAPPAASARYARSLPSLHCSRSARYTMIPSRLWPRSRQARSPGPVPLAPRHHDVDPMSP